MRLLPLLLAVLGLAVFAVVFCIQVKTGGFAAVV